MSCSENPAGYSYCLARSTVSREYTELDPKDTIPRPKVSGFYQPKDSDSLTKKGIPGGVGRLKRHAKSLTTGKTKPYREEDDK